jgi:hypothetical protein
MSIYESYEKMRVRHLAEIDQLNAVIASLRKQLDAERKRAYWRERERDLQALEPVWRRVWRALHRPI